MGKKESIDVLVQGGKATPAPPLGPSLSPLKVNVGQVVAQINEKTKGFAGMEVPVKIVVDTETKEYTITVGTPPTTSMIRKEMKRDKLRHKKEEATIEGGDIGFSKILQIAKAKEDVLMSHTMKGKVKQILGTCLSGGVTVDGKDPRAVQKEVDEGKHKVE
ncbi:MAG: 50S ribosomal protein L11 [Candidatus Aenigmarchaeota archaeon]|nr:50S ribosomal protein L11 [Candidatus Aenigmarchaeota archaeon]